MCHELRNPLHVLETWFAALIMHNKCLQSPTSAAGNGERKLFFADDAGTDEDEIAVITADVESALQQMRTMVDDVLDLRQVWE